MLNPVLYKCETGFLLWLIRIAHYEALSKALPRSFMPKQ